MTDVIIIGAGLAGLTAGVYARLNGYSAKIFEHGRHPGGVVATWKRGEYTFEGGMHFLMGYRPGTPIYDLYEEVGLYPGLEVAPLDKYLRFVDEASGRSVLLSGDLDRVRQELSEISPEDVPLINGIVDGAKAMAGSDFGLDALAKAPALLTPVDRAKMLWGMRSYAKYLLGRYNQEVKEYTAAAKSPLVKKIIDNMFLPEVPVWFVMMILAMASEGQLGVIKNGSRDFAERIAAKFKALGGEIAYRSTVMEIIVENDTAVGVRLADGTEHRAGTVISAGDGHSTVYELLKGKYINKATKARYETWPLMKPFSTVDFGVNRTFDGEPPLSLYSLEKPIEAAGDLHNTLVVRIFNYTNAFAPPGKAVIQVLLETDWDSWETDRQDLAAYKARKEELAAAAQEFLETRYPGISGQVEVADVATPYTLYRYTLNWKGAYEGWAPTPKNITKTIKRTLPGLDRFYLAGQWVTPGGGVPVSMYTGKHAIQMMCRRDKKQWMAVS
ncbi:MAG: NAD(P)/FAD-dependent oxidoreductase [Actinomycetota bacterium]